MSEERGRQRWWERAPLSQHFFTAPAREAPKQQRGGPIWSEPASSQCWPLLVVALCSSAAPLSQPAPLLIRRCLLCCLMCSAGSVVVSVSLTAGDCPPADHHWKAAGEARHLPRWLFLAWAFVKASKAFCRALVNQEASDDCVNRRKCERRGLINKTKSAAPIFAIIRMNLFF